MSRSPSYQKNRRETTAIKTGGGFSLWIFSPMILFAAIIGLLYRADLINLNLSNNQPQTIAPFFTPEVQQWQAEINTWAEQYQLNPNLIATVMQIESCGNPYALSPAGAMGLFQVMPYHFHAGESGYDAHTNAKRGLSYLFNNLNQFGSVRLALAAYNGGPGTAQKISLYWPQETQNYVYWGENIYLDAINGQTSSATLTEWLAAGGNYLCTQTP